MVLPLRVRDCNLALHGKNPSHTVPLHRYAVCFACDVLGEAALDPAQLRQTYALVRFVDRERGRVAFREADSVFRLFLELSRVHLLAIKKPLIAFLQFEQHALQGMDWRILEKIAVRVGIIAPHGELLHHLVFPELLFLAPAISGLLDRQGTVPNEALATSILAHRTLLCAGRLQPVVRESFLYLHGLISRSVPGTRK